MKRRDVLKWTAAGLTGALGATSFAPLARAAGDSDSHSDKGLKEITLEVTGMT